MQLLFLTPYPKGEAASQRFRFEQYFSLLEEKGIKYDVKPFMSKRTWDILYSPGKLFYKVRGIAGGYARRKLLLFSMRKYDYVFIHREAKPFGFPWYEWIIAKVLRKKIIYDFDDAIWLKNYSESNKKFSFLKRYSNAKKLCKWAYKNSCGNEYLAAYADEVSDNVVINPTTIDMENYHKASVNHKKEKLIVGWTGSHSTVRYLKFLEPILQELEQKFNFTFKVISDKEPDLNLKSLEFCKWNKETEITDLADINIGVMPLTNDKWAKGKCGFKALQYMSLGSPALVSPVGVNTKIVDHNKNGFVCETPEQWKESLTFLLSNPNKLQEFGENAKNKIKESYSVKANSSNFLHLFS